MDWHYERLKEDGKIETVYNGRNDVKGEYTGGLVVMNLKAWFDENPQERIKQGWIKHLTYTSEEAKKIAPYNPCTHYRIVTQRQIDPWTIQDEYHVLEKSEEMLLFEQQLALVQGFDVYDNATITVENF